MGRGSSPAHRGVGATTEGSEMTNEREHEGSFAEGQEDEEAHPEDEHVGDFAEGQEEEHH